MTILRTNKYTSYAAASGAIVSDLTIANLIEDPVNDLLFIQNDAYVASTLTPNISKSINHRVNGASGYSSWGVSDSSINFGAGGQGYIGGVFFLNGQTTHVYNSSTQYLVNEWRTNLDLTPFWSMDPANPIEGGYRYDSSGNLNCLFLTYKRNSETAANNTTRYLRRVNKTGDLSTSWPDQNSADVSGNIATSAFFTPVWRNPSTNNLVCIGEYVVSGFNPGAYTGYSLTGAFSANSPTLQSAGGVANRSIQFVGVGPTSGYAIFMQNDVGSDYGQTFYRYNDLTNVVTTLNNYTIPPWRAGPGGATGTAGTNASNTGTYLVNTRYETPAGSATSYMLNFSLTGSSNAVASGFIQGKVLTINSGTSGSIVVGQVLSGNANIISGTAITALGAGTTTSAGNHRLANFGNYHPKYASRTVTDSNLSNTIGFYVPYFDMNGNYQPFYYQWNTLTDNFVQNLDITVTYPGATTFTTYWAYDTVSGSSSGTIYGSQRATVNEIFTYSGTKYLSLIQLHGGGPYDGTPLLRSMITYSLSSDYKTLTYHSNVIFSQTARNLVWLNDDRTLVGIFGNSSFYIYSFNSAVTGWNLVNTQPYRFNVVGRDGRGRIWAQDTYNGLQRIHVILSDFGVPATVSVITNSNVYNFTGSNQSTSLIVNAYDYQGNRIVCSVTLTVNGSSLKLLNLSSAQVTTYTVTTSNSADTTVNALIVGPGSSSISAVVNL